MKILKILAVIPARGGSKGIQNKNIVDIGGHPLIKYTIDAAQKSKMLSDFIVSTDSAEITKVAKANGAMVPFKRPKRLSDDQALSLPVMQHAIGFMEENRGYLYDYVIMLQPTTPLRQTEDIDNAINLLIDTDADSVLSVVDVQGYHPLRMKRIVDGRLINYIDQGYENMKPRQKLPHVYIRNGAIYATRRNTLMIENTFTGDDTRAYIMSSERSVNIDTPQDLLLAKRYFEE
jgi:CMP-N,N'-diacetyllegionaminic acid synthase